MTRAPHDLLQRPLGSLRVSVTDRCNIRCRYCMPERDYAWLPRSSILQFEEIARVARACTKLGVGAVRLTGGEPLLRRDLATLVTLLATDGRLKDLSLTTNGVLLGQHAQALQLAGLHRVTVSLDTLHPGRMRALSRSDRHADIVRGIDAARDAHLGVKLNTVVVRGVNDDEVAALLEFARQRRVEIRFIEYMDVGGATDWSPAQVVPRREILERVASALGPIEPLPYRERTSAPATRYRLADGTVFGIVASTTEPFCRACDRARLTADGQLFLCLYAPRGVSLREALRSGVTEDELATLIVGAWRDRADRGAEERLGVTRRAPLYVREALQADPHREMHTRGG